MWGNRYIFIAAAALSFFSAQMVCAAVLTIDEPKAGTAYPLQSTLIPSQGTIEFMFRPKWDGNAPAEYGTKRILFTTDGNEQYGGGVFTIAKWPSRHALIVRVYDWEMGRVDTSAWKTGVWHHVAVTWDSSHVRSYVDGVAVSIKPRRLPLPASPLPTQLFTGSGPANANPADGSLRFVKVWSEVSTTLVRPPADYRTVESVYLSLPESCKTDDTARLQCAFNAAAQEKFRLIFPLGAKYKITRTLSLPSGLWAEFRGTTLLREGPPVFTLLQATDARNLFISGLIVDGNRGTATPVVHGSVQTPGTCLTCFSGLRLVRVKDSMIEVDVRNTVNAEDSPLLQPNHWHSGLYFQDTSDIIAKANGSLNATTAVFIKDSQRVTVLSSETHHNLGSGISGNKSTECRFFNIATHDNGYSQLSINGEKCFASGIHAWNGAAGYSNINVGHSTAAGRADGTIIEDAVLDGGLGWGLSIVGSDAISARNISAMNHAGANILVRDSKASRLSGIRSSRSGLAGLQYRNYTGTLNYPDLQLSGHRVEDSQFFENACYGAFIESNFTVRLGPGVSANNNGGTCPQPPTGVLSQGILTVEGAEFNDTRLPAFKVQRYGLWFAATGKAELRSCTISGNRIAPIWITGGAGGAKPIVSNQCTMP